MMLVNHAYRQTLSNGIPVALEGDSRILRRHECEDMGLRIVFQNAFEDSHIADYTTYGIE